MGDQALGQLVEALARGLHSYAQTFTAKPLSWEAAHPDDRAKALRKARDLALGLVHDRLVFLPD